MAYRFYKESGEAHDPKEASVRQVRELLNRMQEGGQASGYSSQVTSRTLLVTSYESRVTSYESRATSHKLQAVTG